MALTMLPRGTWAEDTMWLGYSLSHVVQPHNGGRNPYRDSTIDRSCLLMYVRSALHPPAPSGQKLSP